MRAYILPLLLSFACNNAAKDKEIEELRSKVSQTETERGLCQLQLASATSKQKTIEANKPIEIKTSCVDTDTRVTRQAKDAVKYIQAVRYINVINDASNGRTLSKADRALDKLGCMMLFCPTVKDIADIAKNATQATRSSFNGRKLERRPVIVSGMITEITDIPPEGAQDGPYMKAILNTIDGPVLIEGPYGTDIEKGQLAEAVGIGGYLVDTNTKAGLIPAVGLMALLKPGGVDKVVKSAR